MNNTIILIVAICLSIVTSGKGQSSRFIRGQMITTQGDTLHGYIKNIGHKERSQYVIFKNKMDGQEGRYTTKDIRSYQIGSSAYYEVGHVNLLGTSSFFKLFLLKLVEGEVELYRLDYRIKEDAAPFYQYITKFYFYRTRQSRDLIPLTREEYLITLKNEFQEECESFKDKTKTDKYNDEGLSNLIIAYNQCLGKEGTRLFSIKEKGKVYLGFNAGLLTAQIKPNNNKFEDFILNERIGYNFNAYLDQRIWKPFYIRGGLSFMHKTVDGTIDHVVSDFYSNEGEILELESKMTINQIYVPISLKVDIVDKKITPYILAGGYFGIGVNNYSYVDELSFYAAGNETILTKERINPYIIRINVYEVGWKIGGGIEYSINKEQSIYAEFQFTKGGNDALKDGIFYIENKTMGLLVGINL